MSGLTLIKPDLWIFCLIISNIYDYIVNWPQITGKGHFGDAVSAPPIRRWTTRRRAVSAPDISAPFPNFF